MNYELKKEKNQNKTLNEYINKLNNQLNLEINNKNKLIENNEQLKKQIKMLNDSQMKKEEKYKSDMINLYKKIDELKEKLSRYPFELLKGEKLISVIFTSFDNKILHSIICKNTEKFIQLEKELYNYYPEYSKSDNYFLVNGNRVDKFKTLDENKIKNSDNIILSI